MVTCSSTRFETEAGRSIPRTRKVGQTGWHFRHLDASSSSEFSSRLPSPPRRLLLLPLYLRERKKRKKVPKRIHPNNISGKMSELNLIIKSSNADKTEVKADPSITVEDFKKIVSTSMEPTICPTVMRLIYKGRVMKDECTLSFYGINEDGQTIHLVKGSSGTTATTTPAAVPVAAPVPNPYAAVGGGMNNPFAAMGGMGGMDPFAAMGGMGGMGNMQEELMRNPQMMQQMMNSPFMEAMMSNPDMLRNMIAR